MLEDRVEAIRKYAF
ncbi:hypothetical protein DSL72_006206 [Monilinia vaccinii-corymbosi]|uniref:Uncharacterized protein n=1 Tax=Monilinia vaccinii-corymbosi TaxID=61207 RepID=A0A8A3PH41_9HELO|nr:hypothetical protein DSL72_006206 [Monilinia vaccinii-corymbosi]